MICGPAFGPDLCDLGVNAARRGGQSEGVIPDGLPETGARLAE